MKIIVEEDYYTTTYSDGVSRYLIVFVGYYNDNNEFNGCHWDSHAQCNDWIIKGISLWNDCDGDEDTMRGVFAKRVGEDVIKLIDDRFNKDYYLESGTIFKK